MNLPVTTRLSIVKNILSLFLIATISFTWPLWSANRYYPLFPEISGLASLHAIISYAIPFLLILSLIFVFLLRKPKFFIFLSAALCITLLVLDAGRTQYWFYFYMLLLLVLLGYNWRVDNITHYSSSFNAIKITLACVYLLAAMQHFQYDFIHTQWPQFIKPFEKFWTPEQCSYLLKISYAIPFIELFIVVGLFFNGAKIAAISLAVLFHVFSFVVLLLQTQTEVAVILWHLCMIMMVLFVFGGKTAGQKNYGFSFGLYPAAVLLIFGLAVPLYFFMNDKPMKNKMDLMQSNNGNQYIYLSEESKNKLPLYIQSFALQKENEFYKLSVTGWVLHETKTKQVLGPNYLIILTSELNKSYGADALVALPKEENKESVIALK
ncbi:MAG TPA: hypothetical protein VNZ49_11730 [Bacteroidia bacterium]|nr:hypothetical protein [Bacteroidia bacterium]